MLAAPVRRFTVEEYYRLAEAGVLQEDERVELLDGVIVPKMPIGPFHGGSVNWLVHIFGNPSAGRWITSTQNAIDLGEHDEPQPDLALLRPVRDFYRSRDPQAADIFW